MHGVGRSRTKFYSHQTIKFGSLSKWITLLIQFQKETRYGLGLKIYSIVFNKYVFGLVIWKLPNQIDLDQFIELNRVSIENLKTYIN